MDLINAKLNPKQELFCKLYASDKEFFGNGVQAYIEAYKPDKTKKNWYQTARSVASELLTNPNILSRIVEILDFTVNNQVVDRELGFLILQRNDYSAKVAAIREYNKLKQRITDKVEVKTKCTCLSDMFTEIEERNRKSKENGRPAWEN